MTLDLALLTTIMLLEVTELSVYCAAKVGFAAGLI